MKRGKRPYAIFINCMLVTQYDLLLKPRAADPSEDEVLTEAFQSKYINFCKFVLVPGLLSRH